MCEICSELTVEIPEGRHWRRSGVFIVKLWTYFIPSFSVSMVNFEQVNASRVKLWLNSLLPYEKTFPAQKS